MPDRAARPNPQIRTRFFQQLMGSGPEDRRRDSRSLNGLALRVINDDAEFLALKGQWNTLQQAEAEEHPERSFLWALHAWETIARPRGHKLHIIVGYSEGRIVLVMPLVVQRQWPIRIGRWLAPEFGECSDVLVKGCGRSDRWVASAWKLVASSFHLLRIPAICLDARIWPHVEATRSLQKTCTRAPYVDCRQWPDWKAFLGSRSKAFVTDFNRAGKRLRKAGEHASSISTRQIRCVPRLTGSSRKKRSVSRIRFMERRYCQAKLNFAAAFALTPSRAGHC